MTRQFSIPVLSILILAGAIFGYGRYRQKQNETRPIAKQSIAEMSVEIPEVVNDLIPFKYTCEGEGVSPKVIISGTPDEAKSLVIVVDDKNATIGTYTHWLIWNIDPETRIIKEGETPIEAVVGKNGSGSFDWDPICPPSGRTHHYQFRVYALSDQLDLSAEETSQSELLKTIAGITIGYGKTMTQYGK